MLLYLVLLFVKVCYPIIYRINFPTWLPFMDLSDFSHLKLKFDLIDRKRSEHKSLGLTNPFPFQLEWWHFLLAVLKVDLLNESILIDVSSWLSKYISSVLNTLTGDVKCKKCDLYKQNIHDLLVTCLILSMQNMIECCWVSHGMPVSNKASLSCYF